MTEDNEIRPRRASRVAQNIADAQSNRVSAMVMARTGHPDWTGDLERGADDMERRSREKVPADRVRPGAGGEPAFDMPVPDKRTARLRDTVKDPDMVAASASLDRLGLASSAAVLDLALDTADTVRAENSLERMLAHQLASAHQLAMKMAELANKWAIRAEPFGPEGDERSALGMVEACRAANMSAKLMGAYQDGLQALARLRGGGQQTVVVQHVQVTHGGRAVVAGKIREGGRRGG